MKIEECKMTSKEKADEIVTRLEQLYPSSECALEYNGDPWKLFVMARLSAQCTDTRVNIVSVKLFEKYPTLYDMADADFDLLAEIIKPCGLYKMKAKNLIDSCRVLRDRFDGVLPSDMDELLLLPGVGRKIANLIRGDVFHLPAVVADTHCIRLTGRFGFCSEDVKDPNKIEKILCELIAPEKQSDFCHRLVMFGRDVCTARAPKCEKCPLFDLCNHNKEQ